MRPLPIPINDRVVLQTARMQQLPRFIQLRRVRLCVLGRSRGLDHYGRWHRLLLRCRHGPVGGQLLQYVRAELHQKPPRVTGGIDLGV